MGTSKIYLSRKSKLFINGDLLEREKGKQQEGAENTTNKPEMMLQRMAKSFENT